MSEQRILLADFGDLDMLFIAEASFSFCLVDHFGHIVPVARVYYQRKVSPYTKWQGTRIPSFFQVFLVITVVVELDG